MQSQKKAIAQAAAQLVEPGAAIALSAGTTTYELARAVRSVPDLTVVTNSVPVAELLHESGTPGQTVVLTGGVRTPSDALVGPVAVAALRTLHVDPLFLGVHGIDERAGLTTPNLVEAETNQALVQTARQVCVLADHTKWGVGRPQHHRPVVDGRPPRHRRGPRPAGPHRRERGRGRGRPRHPRTPAHGPDERSHA